jgi:perosamine synthetase
MTIPWAEPFLDERDINEVVAALIAGRIGMGPIVAAFEKEMAAFTHRTHAVAVSNGTVALDLALKALAIRPGDEVIVPAISYIATLNAVLYQGATPVFADIHPSTLTIDVCSVARCLTARTRAIVLMDYGGQPCAHDRFAELSRTSRVPLVLDGAQSLGGSFADLPLCKYGVISTTSFHAAKPLTAAEGGMIFTDNDELATTLRILRNQGEDPARKYHHVMLGHNARLSDLHAALGLAQLKKREEILERRRCLAALYVTGLGKAARVEVPWAAPEAPLERRGWFLFPILVNDRDQTATFLRQHGVDTRVCYPLPLYRQPFLARAAMPLPVSCPNAERFSKRVLNLPLFHRLESDQVESICRLLGA